MTLATWGASGVTCLPSSLLRGDPIRQNTVTQERKSGHDFVSLLVVFILNDNFPNGARKNARRCTELQLGLFPLNLMLFHDSEYKHFNHCRSNS